MAKVNWINSGRGDFAIGTNWSTGNVPGPSDIASINAPYTVTSSANETVLAITTSPTATLDLTAGNFTALAGTGTGANAGGISVESGAFLTVGGTVKNSGIITLNGTGFLSFSRATILQGGGKLTLSNNLGNQNLNINGGFQTLTNVDNVISGSGYIDGSLVNESKGVIDANGSSNYLSVNWNSPYLLTNAGILEATSTGGLLLGGSITNTASGVIGALGAGSNVTIQGGGTLSGGTLETTSGGQILITAETIDGSNGHTVTNTGGVSVNNVILLGTINNTGTIAVSNNNQIVVGTGGATLAGSGSVTVFDNTANGITGNDTSATLTNQNTISGAGEIGGNGLLLTNQGVIDATGVNPLIIDTGASAVTNSGTLEATNNSTLFVEQRHKHRTLQRPLELNCIRSYLRPPTR